jgi:hypothetical protein
MALLTRSLKLMPGAFKKKDDATEMSSVNGRAVVLLPRPL